MNSGFQLSNGKRKNPAGKIPWEGGSKKNNG
jgi:hypothetical protein